MSMYKVYLLAVVRVTLEGITAHGSEHAAEVAQAAADLDALFQSLPLPPYSRITAVEYTGDVIETHVEEGEDL